MAEIHFTSHLRNLVPAAVVGGSCPNSAAAMSKPACGDYWVIRLRG
jgi:hypothetical protein